MGHRLLLSDNLVPTANAISNTAAETSFGSMVAMPANTDTLTNSGRTYRFKGRGYLSTLASGQGTLTLKLKWGATTIVSTAAIALPAALVNAAFSIEGELVVCTTGTSGKVSGQGFVMIDNAGAPVSAGMVNVGTGTAGQVTVNTQSAANLQISSTFSVASASNAITLAQLVVEELT